MILGILSVFLKLAFNGRCTNAFRYDEHEDINDTRIDLYLLLALM